jgi:hypothetical protein
LCCEDDNSTVGRVPIESDVIRNHAMSLIWTSYGIIVPIILIIGIFGNVAILIVLSGPVFRGIAYLYLSGLALAHIGVTLSWITISLYNLIVKKNTIKEILLEKTNSCACLNKSEMN